MAGYADEGAASSTSLDAHSVALAKYFHFETDTSWNAMPLRSGGATAGSWAEAGRKGKRGEVARQARQRTYFVAEGMMEGGVVLPFTKVTV